MPKKRDPNRTTTPLRLGVNFKPFVITAEGEITLAAFHLFYKSQQGRLSTLFIDLFRSFNLGYNEVAINTIIEETAISQMISSYHIETMTDFMKLLDQAKDLDPKPFTAPTRYQIYVDQDNPRQKGIYEQWEPLTEIARANIVYQLYRNRIALLGDPGYYDLKADRLLLDYAAAYKHMNNDEDYAVFAKKVLEETILPHLSCKAEEKESDLFALTRKFRMNSMFGRKPKMK